MRIAGETLTRTRKKCGKIAMNRMKSDVMEQKRVDFGSTQSFDRVVIKIIIIIEPIFVFDKYCFID